MRSPSVTSAEPLEDLLTRLDDACAAGDPAAEQRRMQRLHRTLMCHRAIQGLSIERRFELVQEVLIRVLKKMRAREYAGVESPARWVTWLFGNAMKDERRREVRARRNVPLVAPDEVDNSGVFSIAERLDPVRYLAHIEGVLEEYIRAESTRTPRGADQIRAWFELRVRQRDAAEIARELGVADRAMDGRTTVQKWAQRGAILLGRILGEDRDRERAAQIAEVLARTAA